MRLGLDYAWGGGQVTAAEHRALGSSFAVRYLSHDSTKNLSRTEAANLRAGGISIVVVWEADAHRARGGRAAGRADALEALRQAELLGIPVHRPIFFAPFDDDAAPGDQPAINDYFRGVISVLGPERTGAYLGYWPLKRLLDDGVPVAYSWQTYAWSGGHIDPRACLLQFSNGHFVGRVGCDYDRALKADFGQWDYAPQPGPAPDRPASGVLNARLSYDAGRKQADLTPLPGSPQWGSKEEWATITARVCTGGPRRGRWQRKVN